MTDLSRICCRLIGIVKIVEHDITVASLRFEEEVENQDRVPVIPVTSAFHEFFRPNTIDPCPEDHVIYSAVMFLFKFFHIAIPEELHLGFCIIDCLMRTTEVLLAELIRIFFSKRRIVVEEYVPVTFLHLIQEIEQLFQDRETICHCFSASFPFLLRADAEG